MKQNYKVASCMYAKCVVTNEKKTLFCLKISIGVVVTLHGNVGIDSRLGKAFPKSPSPLADASLPLFFSINKQTTS